MKRFSFLLSLWLCSLMVFADSTFRNHRYDAFRMLPVKENNIVFIGNSITNMHEWWEAFGSNSNIINRGVSGAVSKEALANLESILVGKPAKAFIMLGTNDLGTNGLNTPEQVLKNVAMMVDRFQKESPKTELYIQSILPSKAGIRTLELETATNKALAQLCAEKKITYIDLWQDMLPVADHKNSLDGLHLMASGYKIWCESIQQYIGSNSIYPTDTERKQDTGGAAGSWGMRNTYFSMYPVKNTDILMIGDEMIHGGEWHELLQTSRVKNRGTGWGYPGPSLDHTLNAIPAILHDGAPAKICLYAGVADVNNKNNDLQTIFSKYMTIVDKIKAMAPQTKIYIMGLQPTSDANLNSRVTDFNEKLKTIANAEYIDLYTDFTLNGVGNEAFFNGNYLDGMGYIKVAQKIATALNETDIIAFPESEAKLIYQLYNARTSLGNAITKVSEMPEGTGVGSYSTSAIAPLRAKAEEAYSLLCNGGTVQSYKDMNNGLQEQLTATLPKLNMPTFSDDNQEHWYKLSTPLRQNRYLTANGVDASVVGETAHNFANGMWKFVKRGDGKIDIINRDNHLFINSESAYNSPITTSDSSPLTGWDLSYSNTASLFIIHAGTVQLNQTDGVHNYQLYNWSAEQKGDDRNDAGCQFRIEEAGDFDPVIQETNQIMSVVQITNGWYQVQVIGGTHNDMKTAVQNGLNYIQTVNTEYRQNQTNYYPLKYAALNDNTPAATYLYITRDNNAFYFTALNGHGVEENCTANRNVPATKTSISGENGEFVIAHWTAFNAQNGLEKPYVGKFSSQTATYKIFKIGAANFNKYECYKVKITGAKEGSEIGQDVQLTCKNQALRSVASVYNGGWFFVDKGTSLSADDFSATPQQGKNVQISIKNNTITLQYTSGVYTELSNQIDLANDVLKNTTEGSNPGCFSKDERVILQSAIQKALNINSIEGKPEEEIAAAVAELKSAVNSYKAARNDVKFSTTGNETWYYIVNASTLSYCQNKVMTAKENGPLTYADKKVNPNMLWSFWKDNNGKVAIRNYAGKYIGKVQNNGNANAGMTTKEEYNYTLNLWQGSSNHQCAYTIQSDASNAPLHAQQNGTVIVTWKAADNNASLWNFVQITPEELNTKIQLTSKVDHVQVTTGIGNKDVALLRINFALEGLNGNISLNGFKGSVNHATAISTVKIYKTNDAFEYYAGKPDAELLGSAKVGINGTFHIQMKKDITLNVNANPYFWLVADINENAKEGDVIDPEISAYVINGENTVENQGNPQYTTTVFLSASTVEYLNTLGSRYYRIPAITTAKNGWLVSVTDKRFGSNGDLPNNIDVVARVSKDKGVTWTSPVVIAGTADLGGDYGHGDPAIVTDRVTGDIIVLVTSKVGFFYGKPDNCPRIKMIASHDNGITWDAPVDITNSLYGAGCSDPVRKGYHSLFVSSGAFMQTRAGVLMAVAPVRETASTAHGDFTAHVIYSADHGKTWSMSNTAALTDADESKIVELDNGNLMIKSRKGGHPYYVISTDGGKTWSQRQQWNDITDPNCNGDLIRYSSLTNGDSKNRLLASIPNATGRSNVTVFMTYDEGLTWPVRKSICPKGSGYSSLTILPDNTIGCYYEEDGLEDGYQMRFVRFSLNWLSDGQDEPASIKEAVLLEANQVLGKQGVGYPVADWSGRNVLQSAINNYKVSKMEENDRNALAAAIEQYKNDAFSAPVNLPVAGKAYTFTNVSKSGNKYALNYNGTDVRFRGNTEPTLYICQAVGNKYMFVDNNGKYLVWHGAGKGGFNGNKGYNDTYETIACDFSFDRFTLGGNVSGVKKDFFGLMAMHAIRKTSGELEREGYFVVENNGAESGADRAYFNDQYSSAILVEELAYANTPKLNPILGNMITIGEEKTIGTFSAPFATEIPEGVSAFYIANDGVNPDYAVLTKVADSKAIPANQGVILTSKKMESARVVMKPAVAEVQEILSDNQLAHSAGKALDLTTESQFYLLGKYGDNVGFFLGNQGVLGMNKAYLPVNSAQAKVLKLVWNNATGIKDIMTEDDVNAPIYDLSGRRLTSTMKGGVYIQNRKKFIVK